MATATKEIDTIEVLETAIVGEVMLTAGEAKALDKKIRATTLKVNDSMAALFDLMEQAAEGEIHVPLGYSSISDYFADAVDIAPADANERKVMATLLSGKGLSQRAIASALNVSVGTINNDLSDVEKGQTISTDGRTFKPRETVEEAADATEYHGQSKALAKAARSVQAAADALVEAFGTGDHFDHDVNPGDIRAGIREIKAAWSECLGVFKTIGAIN